MKPEIDLTKVHATINRSKGKRAAKQARRDACHQDKMRLSNAITELLGLNGVNILAFDNKNAWEVDNIVSRWPDGEHVRAFKYCKEKLREIEDYVDTEPPEAGTAD